jgi:hypothetical protein
MTEEQLEDRIVAQGVGVVGIFIARGNLQHALFEQVMQGKVDPAWIACIFEHGGKRSG